MLDGQNSVAVRGMAISLSHPEESWDLSSDAGNKIGAE